MTQPPNNNRFGSLRDIPNQITTSDPTIACLLNPQGWIENLPVSPDARNNLQYDIPEKLAPFLHPYQVAKILLEWDCRRMKIPDPKRDFSYSEFYGHKDFDLLNNLNKRERGKYIDSANGGLQSNIFNGLDIKYEFNLSKLAVYHKTATATYALREEASAGTQPVNITGIPYEDILTASNSLKAAVAPFGQIKTVIWQQLMLSTFCHDGWAVANIVEEDVAKVIQALENKQIIMQSQNGKPFTLRYYARKNQGKNGSLPPGSSMF
jgi:hypothetical protein